MSQIFSYVNRIKENVNPDEYVMFTNTVNALKKGTEDEKSFEAEAHDIENFDNVPVYMIEEGTAP